VYEGHLAPGGPDWVYLPVEVPAGVDEIAVSYSYDRPEQAGGPGNALDIGIFDQRGHDVGSAAGFRGWSGGARESFRIGPTGATPGYLPGPVDAGTWHLLLAPYTVAPQGLSYRVEVSLRPGSSGPEFTPTPAPTRASGRGRTWYRGDLHLHTVHSDGQWEPADLVAAARGAGLDFIVSTEHNTVTAAGIWGRHCVDDLLVIDGEEVTTRNGHLVAAGLRAGSLIDWRYRAADDVLPHQVARIHDDGGLAIAAHPFCPYVGCAWKFGFDDVDAVEVWNGPWTPDDEVSLRQWDASLAVGAGSSWLPAVASSDSHHAGQTVGLGQTVVLADDLERDAILSGVRAGRSYLAMSSQVEVAMSATSGRRSAGLGGVLRVPPGAPVRVEVTVRGVPAGSVHVVTDKGTLARFALPKTGAGGGSWMTSARAATYVRAEVRLPPVPPMPFEPMAALTNPIFLDGSG
jgi:predicted metal-dependent phosphoesterase TrpH